MRPGARALGGGRARALVGAPWAIARVGPGLTPSPLPPPGRAGCHDQLSSADAMASADRMADWMLKQAAAAMSKAGGRGPRRSSGAGSNNGGGGGGAAQVVAASGSAAAAQ